MSSQVVDFNTRSKVLTRIYRYHKHRKVYSKFYRRHFDLVSKYNIGLKIFFLPVLSGPIFYGDLVYNFRKIIGKHDFSYHSKNIIFCYLLVIT